MTRLGLIGLALLASLGTALAVLFAGSGERTQTAGQPLKATSVPQPPHDAAPPRRPAAPETTVSTLPVSPAATERMRATAQVRKAVDDSRKLMNETTAYLQQNRPDLAERSFRQLKASRDSLPEFLQVQVDHLEKVLHTGITREPQASLKAAITASEGH